MAVNQPSRQQLDALLRNTLVGVRTSHDNVLETKAVFDAIPDATLKGAGLGYEYTDDDVSNIRSSLNDLAHLTLVANGEGTQANANDFFTFPRRIWGANPVRR